MRVLITGASGFVGSALVGKLLESGHEIIAVSRNPERTAQMLKIARAVDWSDLGDVFAERVDSVVHLAGESVQGLWVGGKAQKVSDSRLACTRQLVEAIRASSCPPTVLMSASGIGFYGEGGEAFLDEEAEAGDDFFAELCVEWEGIASEVEAMGVRVGMLRFGIILGPGGGALKAMLLPTKLGVAGSLGTGKQWWSWVALCDVVSAIQFAIEHEDMSGPINVVSPEPIRQASFQNALGSVVRRPSFMPVPAFAVRAILGTFAQEVLSSKRVIPAKLKAAGFRWELDDLKDAFRASL